MSVSHPALTVGTIAKRVELPNGCFFLVVLGNLLDEPVDAIVNAANGQLAHGGGVAAAIARAAGPALDEEGRTYIADHGPIPTGEAVVTTAGNLSYKGVIHTVGPRLGEGGEERKLAQAIYHAALRAHEKGWESISFPAVSSGIFSVPHEICAGCYVGGVQTFFRSHPGSPLKYIRLCLFKGPLLDHVLKEIALGWPGA